jgi:hypothetical protein
MKLRWRGWTSLAIAATLVLGWSSTAMAQASPTVLRPEEQTRQEIHITLRDARQEADFRRQIEGWGRVLESRDGVLRIQLEIGQPLYLRTTAMRAMPQVADLDVLAPRVPNFGAINSVSRLRASMEQYREAYAHFKKYKKAVGEEDDLFSEGEGEGTEEALEEVRMTPSTVRSTTSSPGRSPRRRPVSATCGRWRTSGDSSVPRTSISPIAFTMGSGRSTVA